MELLSKGLELLVVGMGFVFFSLIILFLMMKAFSAFGAAGDVGASEYTPAGEGSTEGAAPDIATVAAAAAAVYILKKRKISVIDSLLPDLREPASRWGFTGWCENYEETV